MARQEVFYENPVEGKMAITLGVIGKSIGYFTGLAALVGAASGKLEIDINSMDAGLMKESLKFYSEYHLELLYASVTSFILGETSSLAGKWSNWKSNK